MNQICETMRCSRKASTRRTAASDTRSGLEFPFSHASRPDVIRSRRQESLPVFSARCADQQAVRSKKVQAVCARVKDTVVTS